ncbi:MAG: ABC transporter ATP-binding protein [Verrucomicrobiota bacterium]
MLVASKLNKHFNGVQAVKDISFRLEAGKITGIIGPNGSGKTTLVNLLSGMIGWDSGAVVLEDQKIMRMDREKAFPHGLARTFQNVQLIEQMSVWDNLLLSFQPRGLHESFSIHLQKNKIKKVEELLKKVQLQHKRNALVETLSYGQRKLLEIARALALDTPVMLFDEPFAGLSAEMTEIVVGIFQELKAQNKAIAWIEHNMNLIRRLSDYVLFMDEGRLIAEGTPEKVFELPEILNAYLGGSYAAS